MALSPELLQFRSSGVYRLEFDRSQTAEVPSETIRLVVGYSSKGPFNTPIFINDPGFFQEVYGGIDRTLERKGSYFHRSALTALERGPILALNLLRLNNDTESPSVDTIDYQTFSTSATLSNDAEKTALYSGFYNKEKFWYPESEAMLRTLNTNAEIFQLVNLKQKPITVLTRKAQNLTGFDIIAKEWYGVEKVPDFMNEYDYINDYFIDVIVLDGDYSDYAKLAIDPVFSNYFDATKGIIKSSLDTFLGLPEVNQLAAYTGILVPDFIDQDGNNLFIQDIINFETSKTGLFCAINKELFDSGEILSGVKQTNYDGQNFSGIDLVGHNLEYTLNNDDTFNRIKYLSYDRLIKDDLQYEESTTKAIDFDVVATNNDINFDLIPETTGGPTTTPPSSIIASPGSGIANYSIIVQASGETAHPQYSEIESSLFINTPGGTSRTVGSFVLMVKAEDYKWAPVVSLQETAGKLYIGLSVEVDGYEIYIDPSTSATPKMFFMSVPDFAKRSMSVIDGFDGTNSGMLAATYNGLYDDYDEGILTSGDQVVANTGSSFETLFLGFSKTSATTMSVDDDTYDVLDGNNILQVSTHYSIPVVLEKAYNTATLSNAELTELPELTMGNYEDTNGDISSSLIQIIQSLAGAINSVMNVSAILSANQFTLDSAVYENAISVGDYIVADVTGPAGESRLTKVNRISKSGSTLTVTTNEKIKVSVIGGVSTIERYKQIESVIEYYKLFTLNGFTLKNNYHTPNGTQDRIDSILDDTVGQGTSLYNALIDKESVSYRYIVDTFGLGITNESKKQFSVLAKNRKNVLAIASAPSMEDFKKSTDPKFVNINGVLQTQYIKTGGDLSLNPTMVYSLPSLANGSNYISFFAPYITVRDRGKNINVPPASYVSNNFVAKYVNALPWSIVAGPRRGVVSGKGVIGLEINFDRDDRDNLEPFGINPIIFQRGVGLQIAGNKTAQQNIKSALSSTHVREVLIYIEDGIAEILKNYQFEFNTPQTRLEITTLANNFLESVRVDNGVYDYNNIMDVSNNTTEVIDANMGILDTYIEPVKGLEILVHRTTVLKTGAIQTGAYM
jgi:hypothetical protein